MAELPTEVIIGPFTYKVRNMGKNKAKRKKLLGWCRPTRLTIDLREDLAPQRKAEVLLHEVLHSAYDLAGLNTEGREHTEEVVVNCLGLQLVGILRSNPKLIAYIQEPE